MTSLCMGCLYCIVIVVFSMSNTLAIYIPPNYNRDPYYLSNPQKGNRNQVNNSIYRQPDNSLQKLPQTWKEFKNDKEIGYYLKLFNKKILIWTCKNVIEWEWTGSHTPPHLDLYCNVIGNIGTVTWYHGYRTIFTKSNIAKIHNHLDRRKRFTQIISPHVIKDGQHLYKQWTDVRLRINNITWKDSGLYSFKVTSKNRKQKDSQQVFVYIARKKRDSKNKSKNHKKNKSNRTKEARMSKENSVI